MVSALQEGVWFVSWSHLGVFTVHVTATLKAVDLSCFLFCCKFVEVVFHSEYFIYFFLETLYAGVFFSMCDFFSFPSLLDAEQKSRYLRD